MFNIKSLYFRMTIIHYLGMLLLPINAFFFTTNTTSQTIQIIIAIALIFHELDERKNGKQLSKELVNFLKNMDNKAFPFILGWHPYFNSDNLYHVKSNKNLKEFWSWLVLYT